MKQISSFEIRAIGGRNGRSVIPAMPVIAFKYGTIKDSAFDCTAMNELSAGKSRPDHPTGGANIKPLLELNVARSSVDIQQHAAIVHFALNMVLGQRALRCYLMIIEL